MVRTGAKRRMRHVQGRPGKTGRKCVMAVVLTPDSPHTRPDVDAPRAIVSKPSSSDRVFRGILRGAGIVVLLITALILVFLIFRSLSALQRAGFGFLTTQSFLPEASNQFGIAALLPDSALIAAIALVIAVPVGVATAIYISEYAPHALQRPLIAVIDLMAAIPSIIYALWGLFFLMPRILGFDKWLSNHASFIPVFRLFEVNRDLVAVRLPGVVSGWRRLVAGSGRGCRRCGPGAAGLPGCGRNRPG